MLAASQGAAFARLLLQYDAHFLGDALIQFIGIGVVRVVSTIASEPCDRIGDAECGVCLIARSAKLLDRDTFVTKDFLDMAFVRPALFAVNDDSRNITFDDQVCKRIGVVISAKWVVLVYLQCDGAEILRCFLRSMPVPVFLYFCPRICPRIPVFPV